MRLYGSERKNRFNPNLLFAFIWLLILVWLLTLVRTDTDKQ
jgi:hypothetical protein